MIIEVWTKAKYSAAEEAGLRARLARAGLKAKAARLSRLYKIDASFPGSAFDRIAADLLTDTITERYSLADRPRLKGLFRVEVWLKDSVTDVVGESVKDAIRDIMGGHPLNVRFGRAYYVACASEPQLKSAVSEVLVNDIVNVCSVKKIR